MAELFPSRVRNGQTKYIAKKSTYLNTYKGRSEMAKIMNFKLNLNVNLTSTLTLKLTLTSTLPLTSTLTFDTRTLFERYSSDIRTAAKKSQKCVRSTPCGQLKSLKKVFVALHAES